jgi:methionyl-tRNA synthetase
MVQPIIPQAAERLMDSLGVDEDNRQFIHIDPAYRVSAGKDLPTPQPIFPRYVETEGDLTN